MATEVAVLAARFVVHGPVTSGRLTRSVGWAADSADIDIVNACRERARGTWRCEIQDPEGSGGTTYRVRIDPASSCWTGRAIDDHSEQGMAHRIHGCVHLWEWRILSLLD
jgi:hypothetical protein